MSRRGKRLTKKEHQLAAEVKQLLSTLGLNPDEILTDPDFDHDLRTFSLTLAKDQIIRSAVILYYVKLDKYLNTIICSHFFGNKPNYLLWKTKRYQSFNYFILEKLYLLQKLDLVEYVTDIPGWVDSDLHKLNDLRNGIAHSFYLEFRKRKPEWKGQSVFTQAGLDRFMYDMEHLSDFFRIKLYGSKEMLASIYARKSTDQANVSEKKG
jgi:hypothetical protein